MKRLVLAVVALCVVAGAEVARADYLQTCQQCQGTKRHGHHQRHAQACPPQGPLAGLCDFFGFGNRGAGAGGAGMYGPGMYGPPAPTVGYPYYTVRAPRDFLDPNPRGIGP